MATVLDEAVTNTGHDLEIPIGDIHPEKLVLGAGFPGALIGRPTGWKFLVKTKATSHPIKNVTASYEKINETINIALNLYIAEEASIELSSLTFVTSIHKLLVNRCLAMM